MYKNILFCTDLYPGSDYAFVVALDAAEQSGAHLTVLHVLEPRHRYSGHLITEDGDVWGSNEVMGKLQQKLKEYYSIRIEKEDPDFVSFEIRGGVPWMEILRIARKKKIDLIVMGPFSFRGLSTKFNFENPQLGKNAQQVSLRARCPVSIVTSPKQRLVLEAAGKEE